MPGCGEENQDKKKAFELYTKAGEMGSVAALENLAAMYATGEGVARNEKTAQYLLSVISKQRQDSDPWSRFGGSTPNISQTHNHKCCRNNQGVNEGRAARSFSMAMSDRV